MELMTSWEEKGLQRGLQEGRQEGRQEGELTIVLRQLTRRVGPLAPELEGRLRRLSLEEVEELGEAVFDFSTTTDLLVWLQNHPE